MTSERSGAALNSADDDLGFSAVGCLFTGIGLLGAVLPLVGFGFTGGGSTGWLVAAGLLAIACPVALILGSRFDRPTRFGVAYLGLVAVYWVSVYAFG